MIETRMLYAFLDSLKSPFTFADTGHTIRYMNKAAKAHYREGEALIGTSLLDCHNLESRKTILQIWEEMKEGLEECLITDNDQHRSYMRAVRDSEDRLLGYYEYYEPPRSGERD